MELFETIGLYLALMWAIVFVPYTLLLQVRCAAHDRQYVLSFYDAATAVSVIALWARGLPF